MAPAPELDVAAISTGGKERVKVGAGAVVFEPPPFVECACAAAPLEELAAAVKQLTLRPRDGRRLLQQDDKVG